MYYVTLQITIARPTAQRGETSATPTPLPPTPTPFDAAATVHPASGFGIDHWEASLKQLGEDGGADRAVSGVLFHYPMHFFAFFEVTFFTM